MGLGVVANVMNFDIIVVVSGFELQSFAYGLLNKVWTLLSTAPAMG